MSDYTREELISICEAATVPQANWTDRDSAGAQRQVGEAWALLRAGCHFSIDKSMDSRNGSTIWVEVHSEGFSHKDYDGGLDVDTYYLPSRDRLKEAAGKDWY